MPNSEDDDKKMSLFKPITEARFAEMQAEDAARTDKYLRRPLRAAALAALSLENPFAAGYHSIVDDKNVTGQEVAHKMLERGEQLGIPLAKDNDEYNMEKPLGEGLERALSLENANITGLAKGTLKVPGKLYKSIPAPMQGGKTVAAEMPYGRVKNLMDESRAAGNLMNNAPKGVSPQILSGDEYAEKIKRLQLEKTLREAQEMLNPGTKKQSYFDLVNKLKK